MGVDADKVSLPVTGGPFGNAVYMVLSLWASMQENLTMLHANNKAADQPVHPQSVVSKLASCKHLSTRSRSTVNNVSDNRCKSGCRSWPRGYKA